MTKYVSRSYVLRSPLKWYGGKFRMIRHLMPLLPEHQRYVEVCGGAGQLLFAKKTSKEDIYNDIDKDLSHFWITLKNPETAPMLIEALQKTPVSREEYNKCNALYDNCNDPVEKARMFHVLVRQSFNAVFRAGWSNLSSPRYQNVYPNSIKLLKPAHERLQSITLENLDFQTCIPKYDAPKTLYYIDPPYVASTRTVKRRYQHEMTDDDHAELLRRIRSIQGMVILSGYASNLYDHTLRDWKRLEIKLPRHAAQIGKKVKPMATEIIWINPACLAALDSCLIAA